MGHVQRDCPDLWRRFHLTLEGQDPVQAATAGGGGHKHATDLWCCNCGRRGHLADGCRRFPYSPYPRTSLRVVSYARPVLLACSQDEEEPGGKSASRREAEKALRKAEKRRLKRSRARTRPSSPQERPPAGSKRFCSEASSPSVVGKKSAAPDFIRYGTVQHLRGLKFRGHLDADPELRQVLVDGNFGSVYPDCI